MTEEKEIQKRYVNLSTPAKGEIRNPHGRPKGSKDGFKSCMRRLLARGYEPNAAIEAAAAKAGIDYSHIEKNASNAAVLAQIRLMQALMGDARAIEDIADRTDGKPTNQVELSGGLEIGVGIMSPQEIEAFEAELIADGWRLPDR